MWRASGGRLLNVGAPRRCPTDTPAPAPGSGGPCRALDMQRHRSADQLSSCGPDGAHGENAEGLSLIHI
eukprot:13370697-Alexandrium_andersonii.AAC.1